MQISIWDYANCVICLIATFLASIRFGLTNKVTWVLALHVIFILFIDGVFNPGYWGDQYRYYAIAIDLREGIPTPEGGTTLAAGRMFSYFPLFIDSYKSVGFINYMLYLGVYLFIITRLKSEEIIRLFKIIYFGYPSLFLFTSLGLRDWLITTFMFFSLYAMFFYRKIWLIGLLLWLMYPLKGQNVLIMLLTIVMVYLESITIPWLKGVAYIVFMVLLVGLFFSLHGALLYYRSAMFVEDTRQYVYSAPDWTPLDLYRYFFAPFYFDARNAMQILQSLENTLVAFFAWKIIKLRKAVKVSKSGRVVDNFFILSGLMYSYVVFNYGTITRYKFPFVVCWLLINLVLIDKRQISILMSKD